MSYQSFEEESWQRALFGQQTFWCTAKFRLAPPAKFAKDFWDRMVFVLQRASTMKNDHANLPPEPCMNSTSGENFFHLVSNTKYNDPFMKDS